MDTQKQKIIHLAKQKTILTTRDVLDAGLHHETLKRMCDEGILEKAGRGLYRLINADISIHHDLAVAAAKAPKGVICLLSALLFHEITTQLPHEVWMAFIRGSRVPRLDHPCLRVVYFSKSAMAEGVELQTVDHVQINITNPSKTIADCFKFRNKIGLDVSLEALKEGLRDRKCTRDEIWHYAKINRVSQIIRPYLEAMV
ncbi:type IV toxin-antitoxin system AbiEi family antitoxin domain-containing protein [bacterium]|nr:type IV toxin-antitoxin system AbiEi family antitoxin domain-containing protein [bacterium]